MATDSLELDTDQWRTLVNWVNDVSEKWDLSDGDHALIHFIRLRYHRCLKADGVDVPALRDTRRPFPPERLVMHDTETACNAGIVHAPPCVRT